MDKTSLLVIDMLNEYLQESGLVYCERCRKIIPAISRCIDFSRKNGILVTYSNTCLTNEQDVMVKKWGLHAIEGTRGAQVVSELAPKEGDLIVTKKGYDGFFNTSLHQELQGRGIKTLVMTGIHTHVCVLLTAVGAYERGYNVIALEDCMTTSYLPNHENRLRFFKTHIGELISSEDWMLALGHEK